MTYRMAVSMTIAQVRDGSKTVTRRAPDSWVKLMVGDRVTLIEKGMGLKKGEKQVPIRDVEITSLRNEPLGKVGWGDELAREGFPEMSADEFMAMWCKSHKQAAVPASARPKVRCLRIEWKYL